MNETIIIGAGMAGIACARALAEADHPARVLDKGRGIGGRMATRRLDPAHPLPWIAANGTKPGRGDSFTTWLAQAGPEFSRTHLEASAEQMAARMLPLLADVQGVDPAGAVFNRAHRWRHAQTRTPLGAPFLYDWDTELYAGGDWCLGARAEDAWRSGRAMAASILQDAGTARAG